MMIGLTAARPGPLSDFRGRVRPRPSGSGVPGLMIMPPRRHDRPVRPAPPAADSAGSRDMIKPQEVCHLIIAPLTVRPEVQHRRPRASVNDSDRTFATQRANRILLPGLATSHSETTSSN
eukprot:86907-Hanusia_phi.AAC.7